MITMHTNFGDITIELDFEKAPNTAKNFKEYAESGFYDGLTFHRVIRDFMIQGGGFTEDMQQKQGKAPIENEADNGLKNHEGTLAMARTMDPHSASSQFFINVSDNDALNFKGKDTNSWGYCVFGKVTDGMSVVKKIENVSTTSRGGHSDVPEVPVIIEKVVVAE